MSSISNNSFHTVYIGIGSNQGDRISNCLKALDLMRLLRDTSVEKISSWYETEALIDVGAPPQGAFINGVAKIITKFKPPDLLCALLGIETSMGRPHPRPKGAPRVIDLDILFYDELTFESEDLTIPHPEVIKRLFVLAPLCDIEPALPHPVLGLTMRELERSCRASYPDLNVERL